MKEVEFGGKTQFISFTQVKACHRLNWYVALVAGQGHRLRDAQRIPHLGDDRHGHRRGDHHALLGMLIRVLMQPLPTMGRAMHDIAEGEGDLTKRLVIHGQR